MLLYVVLLFLCIPKMFMNLKLDSFAINLSSSGVNQQEAATT